MIPENWTWSYGEGCMHEMENTVPDGQTFKYIDIDSIDNKKHIIKQYKTIDVSEAPSRARRKLHAGDTLFSMVRPYLENIAFVFEQNSDSIASTGFYVCKPKKCLIPRYLFLMMTSEYVVEGLNRHMRGDNSPSIKIKDIADYLYPIPPINEQKRIVSKIEELFNIVTEHENIVDTTNKLVMQLRLPILNYAIQGKLVPQDPNDRPVNIDCKNPIIRRDNSYYEIINGKEVCIDDEIPFEIPESWQWVHGRDCMKKMENTSPSGDSFDYIDIDSVDNKIHSIRTSKKISVRNAPSRAKRKLHSGDTIFSMVRPYLENIAFVTEQYANSIASTGFYVCRPSKYLSPQYLYYLMLSRYVIDGLNSHMKGDNSPSINSDVIVDFLYPIPPMNEQERIVSKIENLLNSLKSLQ